MSLVEVLEIFLKAFDCQIHMTLMIELMNETKNRFYKLD
jgi:hypothetical protein